MFDSLSDRITASLKSLRGRGRLSEADVDKTVREIRRALLDADVAVPVVRSFTAAVRERAVGEEVSKALNPAQQVVKIVNDELVDLLGGHTGELTMAKKGPTVIMLAGLQGAGKTTLAGKLGLWLKEQRHTPVLVAADLQRPNAVQQLQIVGERAGVPVFAPEPGNGVGDPVLVALNGVSTAQFQQHDVVIVDTAGRLGIDEAMMQQARDIRDAVHPHDTLFVVDAMIGQDAARVAEAFRDGVGFTGVVLSKLDGDARGGAALSVTGITERPILFASTGEALEDFELFHPDRMAGRILDMGDVLTLIEQAQRKLDAAEAEKMADKIVKGEDFTFDDFLAQLAQIEKLGNLKGLLAMMPNAKQYREAIDQFDERQLDRTRAMITSMTPLERSNPRIINGSRRSRIARGSGTTVTAVNQLLKQFEQMRTMMKSMKGGGMPQMPGMPGMGGGKKSRGRQVKQAPKKKGKSGNPAKRAQQEARDAQRREESAGAAPGAAFGAGGASGTDPQDIEIPESMKKLFGGQ